MRLRQEQVVFVATTLVLGLLSWSLFGEAAAKPRGSRSRGDSAEFRHYAAPPVEVALARAAATPPLLRELFAPPRDTRPLPPLELVEPPRRPLPGLRPPPDPGPAPRAYGRLLRAELAVTLVPDLFQDPADEFGHDAVPPDHNRPAHVASQMRAGPATQSQTQRVRLRVEIGRAH